MKILKILVYAHPATDLSIIQNVLSSKDSVEAKYIQDEEHLVQALTAQSFDLLIIDLDLEKTDYKKAQMLTDMIYPDAAFTELDFSHADFLSYKIDSLILKWKDAQSDDDSGRRFFDNPSWE